MNEPVNPRSTLRYELDDRVTRVDQIGTEPTGGTYTATPTEAKRRELHRLVDELPDKILDDAEYRLLRLIEQWETY